MPFAPGLADLRDRVRRIERPAATRHGTLPFGVTAIDRALPGHGLALGAVHEILGAGGDEEDCAAAAGFVAGILTRLRTGYPTSPSGRSAPGLSLSPLKGAEGWGAVGDAWAPGEGIVLWCLKQLDLYGPGLVAHGLDPARLGLVRARRDDDILWAVEEALRLGSASGLAAVVGEIGRLPMVASRRLQLAAERSGVTALLLRRWRNAAEAAAERTRPSAALTRWRITALPSTDAAAPSLILPPLEGEGRVRGTVPTFIHLPAERGSESGRKPGIGRPRWRVELLRCRGGMPGIWDVEVADAAGFVSLSAGLADRPVAPAEEVAVAPRRRAG